MLLAHLRDFAHLPEQRTAQRNCARRVLEYLGCADENRLYRVVTGATRKDTARFDNGVARIQRTSVDAGDCALEVEDGATPGVQQVVERRLADAQCEKICQTQILFTRPHCNQDSRELQHHAEGTACDQNAFSVEGAEVRHALEGRTQHPVCGRCIVNRFHVHKHAAVFTLPAREHGFLALVGLDAVVAVRVQEVAPVLGHTVLAHQTVFPIVAHGRVQRRHEDVVFVDVLEVDDFEVELLIASRVSEVIRHPVRHDHVRVQAVFVRHIRGRHLRCPRRDQRPHARLAVAAADSNRHAAYFVLAVVQDLLEDRVFGVDSPMHCPLRRHSK